MAGKSPIRVLHCPHIVGGNPQGLARAERELGLRSRVVAFTGSPFGYPVDEILWRDGESPILSEIKRWRLLYRALKDFDIIHFNFGHSILPHWNPLGKEARLDSLSPVWRKLAPVIRRYARVFELRDLPVLKKAGKGIVVTYQGDDARQGDVCRAHFDIHPADEVEPGYYSLQSDERKRQRIARFARYADRIFALNPDLLHVLPTHAQFLPYTHIDLREWRPAEAGKAISQTPVVVHAPSHRGVKGTRFVLDAVSRLQEEGIDLELVLIENAPHKEVKSALVKADLVVDQLLCGWYGGFAVEAMALAKPVVCYIREGDLKFIPERMREELPTINATPRTIYEVLKELLTTRKRQLPDIGQRSRAYVENWHDPLKIAARLKSDYEAIMASKCKCTERDR